MRFAVVVALLGILLGQAGAWANSSVLSFKEWKTKKVSQVQQEYNSQQSEYLAKKSANPKDVALKSLYRNLKNSKAYLDELRDLSVTDYFISYLSEFKDKKSTFDSAIAKLEPKEIQELMGAYANSLLKTSGEGLSTAADGSTESASK